MQGSLVQVTRGRHAVRAGAVLAAVAVAFSTSAGAQAQTSTVGASGVGDTYYSTLGNGGYDVQHYDLTMRHKRLDPMQTVNGDVIITAIARQDLSRFNLDFAGDSVRLVKIDGKEVAFTRDKAELIITPGSLIRRGTTFKVEIYNFETTPYKWGTSKVETPAIVASQDGTVLAGQPDAMNQVYPSNDHPSDPATFTFRIETPKQWLAVASGDLKETVKLEGDRVRYTYDMNKPMATHVTQMAVGAYKIVTEPDVNGVKIRHVLPTRLYGALKGRVGGTGRLISKMEKQIGVVYPFNQYGMLITDVDMGFALETQTLSVFPVNFSAGPVLSHEAAHQWFGDALPIKSWPDLWISEGHATFHEYRYTRGARTAKEIAYYKAVYAGFEWRARTLGPVANPKKGGVWDLFNSNVYDGGAVVLYALEQEIGAKAFAKFQTELMKQRLFKPTSTADVIRIASEVAGRDLSGFLKPWLYGTKAPAMPGHPDWKQYSDKTTRVAGDPKASSPRLRHVD